MTSVFANCTNLMALYLLSTSRVSINALAASIFSGTPLSAGGSGSIYVPASLIDSYKASAYWTYVSARFVAFVPCESISLPATETINGLGEQMTLTPTMTPAGANGIVEWSSSDPTVASVDNGVVTSYKYGTTTITATCDGQSASCTLTVALDLKDAVGARMYINYNNRLLDYVTGNADSASLLMNVIGANQHDNVYPCSVTIDTGDLGAIYPIQIPHGAKTITFAMADFAPVFVFYRGNAASTDAPASKVRDGAAVLDGETPSGGTPYSISGWTYDTRIITIPDNPYINCFTLTIHAKDATAYNNYSLANLSITFGYE